MTGRTSYITDVKINSVYELVRKNKYKKLVADNFMISVQALDNWLQRGKETLEAQPEALEEIIDSYLMTRLSIDEQFEKEIELHKEDFVESINAEKYDPKLKNVFMDYFREKKSKELEAICKKRENEIIDSTVFDKDEENNKKAKQYAKFFRAYQRGVLATTNWWQENIDKHSPGAKNVALNLKGLELMHRETFVPKDDPQVVKHEHSLTLHEMTRNMLESKKQIEQQNPDVIEGEYTKE